MSGQYLPVFRGPAAVLTYDGLEYGNNKEPRESIEELHPKHKLSEEHDQKSMEGHEEEENEEASNIELFYDLFFVANLTVFTFIHDVTSIETFRQYVGFFTILWFTWYGVSLYDARFAMDCLVERVFKTLHFGVMIWLASIGPQFSTGKDTVYYKYLTLTLMASRLILFFQYLQLIYLTKGYQPAQEGEKRKTPLFIIAGTYFFSAMVYLGLFWAPATPLSWAWYIIAIVEAVLVTGAANFYKLISSQGSHLADRMCLLTLIILGEGVIGIAKQCQTIAKLSIFDWVPSNVINICCSVLILYLIYMIYFDWAQKHWMAEKQFGFRPQMWTAFHFLLHLALVMAVEGINQCIAWRAAVVAVHPIDKIYAQFTVITPTNDDQWAQAYKAWNKEAMSAVRGALSAAKDQATTVQGMNWLNNVTAALRNLAPCNETSAPLSTQLLYDTSFRAIFSAAGYGEKPKLEKVMKEYENEDKFDVMTYVPQHDDLDKKLSSQFELTFIYLFICIGLVVIMCTGIAAMSNRSKTMQQNIRLACSAFIGMVIAGLSAIAVGQSKFYRDFTQSPWILPVILLCLLIVTVLNNVKLSLSRKRGHGRHRRT